LTKESHWQTLIYPKTNATIQGVVLQIINCPYQGTAKRIYLQGNIIGLMALQLAPFWADNTRSQLPPRLKKRNYCQDSSCQRNFTRTFGKSTINHKLPFWDKNLPFLDRFYL
jgi:hypothetical protein